MNWNITQSEVRISWHNSEQNIFLCLMIWNITQSIHFLLLLLLQTFGPFLCLLKKWPVRSIESERGKSQSDLGLVTLSKEGSDFLVVNPSFERGTLDRNPILIFAWWHYPISLAFNDNREFSLFLKELSVHLTKYSKYCITMQCSCGKKITMSDTMIHKIRYYARVAKCHRYGIHICVKILVGGKV